MTKTDPPLNSTPEHGTPDAPSRPFIPRLLLAFLLLALLVGWLWPESKPVSSRGRFAEPAAPQTDLTSGELPPTQKESSGPRRVTMDQMLGIARESLQHLIANVNNYTARLVKQEQDRSGTLQPESEIFLKVQTRHQLGSNGDPLKVYMRFDSPENVQGREVIWVENQNDGKLLVREAGMLGGMMTVPLAPDNFLAMRGQRYPITEIGLTRLLEKLIERGEADREDPNVQVMLDESYTFEGKPHWRLSLSRSKPSGRDNDFSKAELVIDRERHVVVHFSSMGWPNSERPDELPDVIESYTYHELKFNVGLSDIDFDTQNPDYTFAKQ